MQVYGIKSQTFGISYTEIAIKTLNAAKNKPSATSRKGLSLYKQLLLKNDLFKSKEVSDSVKANYFAYLTNLVE